MCQKPAQTLDTQGQENTTACVTNGSYHSLFERLLGVWVDLYNKSGTACNDWLNARIRCVIPGDTASQEDTGLLLELTGNKISRFGFFAEQRLGKECDHPIVENTSTGLQPKAPHRL